jgi:hypothetical protein
MVSLVAVAAIASAIWLCVQYSASRPKPKVSVYLLVEPVGPSEWLESHRLTIQWRGEEIPLPAAFKMEDGQATSGGFGAPPGFNETIQLGKDQAKVLVSPATEIYFSNDQPRLSVTPQEIQCLNRLLIGPPGFLQEYGGAESLSEDEYFGRIKECVWIRTVRDD